MLLNKKRIKFTWGDIIRMEYYVASKIHMLTTYFKAGGNVHEIMLNERNRRPIYIYTMNPNTVLYTLFPL